MSASPLPVFYLAHGGGPWPWMSGPRHDAHAQLAASLRALPGLLAAPPKAVLMVTAHWEAPEFTLGNHPAPGMLYDYYGFPPETYEVKYPAPGARQSGTGRAGAGHAARSGYRRCTGR